VIRWLYLLFVALIFSGSIGVDVFKHVCSRDGVQLSLFDNAGEHCSMEHETHACCAKPEQEKDCCSDEVSVVQMHFDFFQKTDVFIVTDLFILPTQPFSFQQPEDVNEVLTVGAVQDFRPPPISNSRRRALYQVYII